MKSAFPFHFLPATCAAILFTACSGVQFTHVPPGKSASAAIAERKAGGEPVAATPADGTMPVAAAAPAGNPPELPMPQLPGGQVSVPTGSDSNEKVAEAYSRGTFAMQAGQSAEAIKALEETVQLDPDFTDAWGKLAILYQKDGQSLKATEAFKKAKRLGDANGGTVTRDAAGGLQFP
jgi:hypothetical protein